MATYRLELFKKGSKTADLKITSTSATKNYQIAQVEYEKKLFAPCYAEVTITVTDSKKDNSLPDIAEFTGADSAKLYVCAGNKENLVGEDYIVYQVKPRAANTTKTIVLTLYSRDKLLTLDKFCHVYLNQRLGADIITGMLKSGGQLASCGVKYTVGTARLQLTDIEIKVKDKSNPPKDVPKKVELIQPYRVQYNEDFYSFISRTACACGEFLFFEDGTLQLGVSTADKYTIANDTASVIKVEKSSCKSSGLTIRSYYNDYRYKQDKKPESIGEKELTGDEDAAFDEYFDVYDRKDLPDTLKRETPTPKPYFKFCQDALCSKLGVAIGAPNTFTITSIIASIAYNVAQELGANAANRDYMNGQFKKNVFDSKKTNSPSFISEQQEQGDKLSQFSDLDSGGKILHRFFSEVRKCEQQADLDKLTLQVKTDKVYVKLGSLVTFGGTEYAVTRICGKYNPGVAATTDVTDVTDVPDVTEIDLVPKCTVTIYTFSSTTNTYKQLDSVRYVPPYSKCSELPAAQPQVAIVADVDDPRYMGRVRIRYPWQNKDDVPSPWIRILSPLASKKKNIHFEPAKDDEVMVGYIGGNIDRPYVAGSLFNRDTPIHGSLYLANSSTIKIGSQKLDFKGGTYDEWINDFAPFWDAIIQFLPGVSDKMSDFGDSNSVLRNLKGNITLTDAYGFWTIKGDTAARSVTINSLWGKVSISAFSGINIESAGDIKIKGKNIDILASNNVNIQSGLAIKEEEDAKKFSKMDGASEFVNAAVVEPLNDILLKKVDLSLLRTVRDLVLPRKEGTLKVKSYRHLLLEAGDGTAFDRTAGVDFMSNSVKDSIEHRNKHQHQYEALETELTKYKKYLSKFITSVTGVSKDLRKKSFALSQAVKTYNSNRDIGEINENNLLKKIIGCQNLEGLETYTDLEQEKNNCLNYNPEANIGDIEAVQRAIEAFEGYMENKVFDAANDWFPICPTDEGDDTFGKYVKEATLNLIKDNAENGEKWFNVKIGKSEKTIIQRILYQKAFNDAKIDNMQIDIALDDIEDTKLWTDAVSKALYETQTPPTPIKDAVKAKVGDFLKEYKSLSGKVNEYNWNPKASGKIMISQKNGVSFNMGNDGVLVESKLSLEEDLKLKIARILIDSKEWNRQPLEVQQAE